MSTRKQVLLDRSPEDVVTHPTNHVRPNTFHLGCLSQFRKSAHANLFVYVCVRLRTPYGTPALFMEPVGSSGAKHFGVRPCRIGQFIPTLPLSGAPVCCLRDPRVSRKELGPQARGLRLLRGSCGQIVVSLTFSSSAASFA